VLRGQVPAESVAGDVEEVRDRALRYSLENGVAFLHKTLSAPDQAAVRRLFASGAVQVRGSCGCWVDPYAGETGVSSRDRLLCGNNEVHASVPVHTRHPHRCSDVVLKARRCLTPLPGGHSALSVQQSCAVLPMRLKEGITTDREAEHTIAPPL